MANSHGGSRAGAGRKPNAEVAKLRALVASLVTDDDWTRIVNEILKDARYGELRSVSYLLALRYGVTIQSLTAANQPEQSTEPN